MCICFLFHTLIDFVTSLVSEIINNKLIYIQHSCNFSVRINVTAYDDSKETASEPYYPVRVSPIDDPTLTTVNVMVLSSGDTSHFILIKSLNALLMKGRNSKHHCQR